MVKIGSKNVKNVKLIMMVTIILAAVLCAVLFWVNDYYKATNTAKKAMLGNESIEVIEKDGYYLFDSSENRADTEMGIIFYPGGKVDEKAYAPLLLELAEHGFEVYLVKMPAKLAIFGANAAEDIMEDASHIVNWTMMGHSLGGAMAADFSASHDKEVDALVLLAAYSLEDLSSLDMDVYSFYGSEDRVLNMEKYKECQANFPDDVIEEVIEGGNHAYYAHYGEQEGDGTATITREEQQEIVLDLFLNTKAI
ncbi:MAG: hypothetical protein IJF60_03695 [Agathobacter sp.]|nr:hypothetical protein [Agathobacter sp.]